MSVAKARKRDYNRPTFEELKARFLEAEAKAARKREQEVDVQSQTEEGEEEPQQEIEHNELNEIQDEVQEIELTLESNCNENEEEFVDEIKPSDEKLEEVKEIQVINNTVQEASNQPLKKEKQSVSIEEKIREQAKVVSKYNSILQNLWDAQQPNTNEKPKLNDNYVFNSESEAMQKLLNKSIELLEEGYAKEALNLLVKMRDGGYHLTKNIT